MITAYLAIVLVRTTMITYLDYCGRLLTGHLLPPSSLFSTQQILLPSSEPFNSLSKTQRPYSMDCIWNLPKSQFPTYLLPSSLEPTPVRLRLTPFNPACSYQVIKVNQRLRLTRSRGWVCLHFCDTWQLLTVVQSPLWNTFFTQLENHSL